MRCRDCRNVEAVSVDGHGVLVCRFRTYEEFWDFCLNKCPNFKLGCAKTCELRKALKSPHIPRAT